MGGVDRAWICGLGSYMHMRPLKLRDSAEGEKQVCRGLGNGGLLWPGSHIQKPKN